MELLPSIDLLGGRVVRLRRGDYDAETVYGDDPVAVAEGFAAAGATWVHVVDLDAARSGERRHRDQIAAIAAATPLRVEASGGVRDRAAVEDLLDAGVARVVLGTAAVEDPRLVEEVAAAHPNRVAVGLDVRGDEVAVRGWTEGTGRSLADCLAPLEGTGLAAVIVTQINRDATMSGPDLDLMSRVKAMTELDVVASGGVGSLDDLRALSALGGISGVIVGKAIYEGAFTVEEAVAACAA